MVHLTQCGHTGGHELMLTLSRAEARRFLANYHFTPTDVPGVFERLGTVQYDPLNPVGRNPDLVLQARVPGCQVDDWQKVAYTDRLIYDAWDKHAIRLSLPVGPLVLRPLQRARCWRAGIGQSFRRLPVARPAGQPWASHLAPTTNG